MRMKEAGGDTQTIIISFSVEPMVKLITDYEQAKNKLIVSQRKEQVLCPDFGHNAGRCTS